MLFSQNKSKLYHSSKTFLRLCQFQKKNIELYQVMLGAMFQDMSCLWFIVIKFGLARGVNLKPRSIQVEDKIEEGIDLIKNLG